MPNTLRELLPIVGTVETRFIASLPKDVLLTVSHAVTGRGKWLRSI
ncbi:MAG: hypothetical protein V7L20_06105 [Nostoc sp.]